MGIEIEFEDEMEGDEIDMKTKRHANHDKEEEMTVREFQKMMEADDPMEFMLQLKAKKAADIAEAAKKHMEKMNAAKPRVIYKKRKG